MKPCLAAMVLALGACGASSGNKNAADAACRSQAYDDPTVKQLMVQNLSIAQVNPDSQFALSNALHNAYNACLRQKGITVRGGVEAVRPQ